MGIALSLDSGVCKHNWIANCRFAKFINDIVIKLWSKIMPNKDEKVMKQKMLWVSMIVEWCEDARLSKNFETEKNIFGKRCQNDF